MPGCVFEFRRVWCVHVTVLSFNTFFHHR
jgi:hypothetical protein